ncbi:uncharacterized protein [Montipora capricornis]|uniref:uncharacterized protein n=1 Tax=Montipora capricornis TaxID=246305 RepID=UPI0035F17521
MEWWESAEEYNPGMSLWRGRKISDDASCESDIEIIEEKAAPKDKSIKKCKLEITTAVADTSVVEISSDDDMEVDSPLKHPTKKRERISSDDSIEELIASVSGLSSNDNTPQKPRLPTVKRPKENAHGSPAKKNLFDEENSDDNMDISILRKGRRLYANQDEIDKLDPVHVKKVPLASQGSAKYEVLYNDAEPLSVVVDNWKWGRAQPCKRAGFGKGGRRSLQLCLGSLECANKKCAYLKIQKSPNKVDFYKSKRCMHCHREAIKKTCSPRKYVENDRCHKKR